MDRTKRDENFKEIKVKKINPIYVIGPVWLVYALIFPLYRITDLLIAAAVSIIAFILAKKLIPEKTFVVPLTSRGGVDERCAKVLEKGNDYITWLVKYNDRIADRKMSDQIQEITDISRQMFDFTAKNPNLASDLGNFIDYYYPTTNKLLETYCDMNEQEVKSANVSEIVAKVSSVMGTIVTAFRKQLDQMYEHKALDVKTDINVLKSVLASEGLTEDGHLKMDSDFKMKGRGGE